MKKNLCHHLMSSQGNHHDGQGMVVTIQIKCMTLNLLCDMAKNNLADI